MDFDGPIESIYRVHAQSSIMAVYRKLNSLMHIDAYMQKAKQSIVRLWMEKKKRNFLRLNIYIYEWTIHFLAAIREMFVNLDWLVQYALTRSTNNWWQMQN